MIGTMTIRKYLGGKAQFLVNRYTRFDWNEEQITSAIPYFQKSPKFKEAYDFAMTAWDSSKSESPDIRWRLQTVLWAAKAIACRLETLSRPGVFVECGTGLGFNASALCRYLEWNELGHRILLIDTFLPFTPDKNGEQLIANPISDKYATSEKEVRIQLQEFERVEIVKGRVPEILGELENGIKVDFLHIDMNSASAEIAAIEYFWPRLNEGAIVVLDDFAWHDRIDQGEAFDIWSRKLHTPILTLGTGQGLILK